MNRIPKTAPDDAADDEQALELPVNPDESFPLIPDDEREVQVPS